MVSNAISNSIFFEAQNEINDSTISVFGGAANSNSIRPSQISTAAALLLNKGDQGGPHMCPYCAKGWRTKSALEMHIRVHTGEEPFICPICGKGHKQKGQLKAKLRQYFIYRHFSNQEQKNRILKTASTWGSHIIMHTFLHKWTGQKILDDPKTTKTKLGEPLIFLACPYMCPLYYVFSVFGKCKRKCKFTQKCKIYVKAKEGFRRNGNVNENAFLSQSSPRPDRILYRVHIPGQG